MLRKSEKNILWKHRCIKNAPTEIFHHIEYCLGLLCLSSFYPLFLTLPFSFHLRVPICQPLRLLFLYCTKPYTVRRNVLKDKARKKKAPYYCGWLSQFCRFLVANENTTWATKHNTLVKGSKKISFNVRLFLFYPQYIRVVAVGYHSLPVGYLLDYSIQHEGFETRSLFSLVSFLFQRHF